MIEIREIDYRETLPIRRKVMWPNRPLDFVKLTNDEIGTHYGLFIDKKLISIISTFENGNKIQFRKFATLHEYQGEGYGTLLLNFVIRLAKQKKYEKIWCNSRADKANFYSKFGLVKTDKFFKKEEINFITMEKNLLPQLKN